MDQIKTKPRKSKWPFKDMEIGEEYFSPFPKEYGAYVPSIVSAAWQCRMATLAANHAPKKFKTEMDHYQGGVRVRRVS